MEAYIIYSLFAATSLFAGGAAFTTYKYIAEKHKHNETKLHYAMLSNKEVTLNTELISAQNENSKLRERAIEAETSLSNLKEQFTQINQERQEAIRAREQVEKNFYNAQTEIELALQKVSESEKRHLDLEKQREQAFKDAREAMFTTGKEVLTKEAEEISRKTFEQFGKIAEKFSALSSNVASHDRDLKTVIKSMSSSVAAGQFSEIGLNNILKEYGLIEGQDFFVQYSTSGNNGIKRPDAVLFVRNNVFVIDSKASHFFLELAEAEGTDREQAVLNKIKKSMNLHINSLSSKGYLDAIKEDIKKTRSDIEIGHIQLVMFLCNESHVDKVANADPEFLQKLRAKDIVVSGPTGLQGLLAFAKYSIAQAKRDQNRALLIDEIKNLLGSISIVVDHTIKVRNGLKSAAQNCEKLIASINSNLLSKAHKVTKLGMPMPADKKLPNKIDNFAIINRSHQLIEVEAIDEDSDEESEEELEAISA